MLAVGGLIVTVAVCPVIDCEQPAAEVALVTEYVVVTVGVTVTVAVPAPVMVVLAVAAPFQ